MKTNSGITVIELIIALAIIGILSAIIIPSALKNQNGFNYSTTSHTCEMGYVYVNGYQQFDENGHGVRCQ